MARIPQPITTIGTGPIWGSIYATLTLVSVFFAVFMHVEQGRGLTTPYVLFPALGSIWFAFRAYFAFTAKTLTDKS